jgi:hypothetical protein
MFIYYSDYCINRLTHNINIILKINYFIIKSHNNIIAAMVSLPVH